MSAKIVKFAPAQLASYAARANAAHKDALAAIDKALGHVIAAGLALIEAQSGMPHGKWEQWCEKNLKFSLRTAGRYMRIARVVPKLPAQKRHAVADLSLREACKAIAGTRTMTSMGSSLSEEWYSPESILEPANKVMGSIDLDPCWHRKSIVRARRTYTAKDDGLSKQWQGKVFLNPPYGRKLDQWMAKLVESYEAGSVTEAICLLPARTDAKWFSRLDAFPRCFIRGRLAYGNSEYGVGNPPFPSVVIYLGRRVRIFANAFRHVGPTFVRL